MHGRRRRRSVSDRLGTARPGDDPRPRLDAGGKRRRAGCAAWDYPFVAGLAALAADVRAIFDGQGLTRGATGTANLVAYSADWSSWMGWQHAGANGQWPHLDALWASPTIDLVGFDNYLPLSDWTTGDGGLDAIELAAARARRRLAAVARRR